MKKENWIDREEENKSLIKLYSNFIPHCTDISQRVKLAQEITRLSNLNNIIYAMPLSECLEGKNLFKTRVTSIINHPLKKVC